MKNNKKSPKKFHRELRLAQAPLKDVKALTNATEEQRLKALSDLNNWVIDENLVKELKETNTPQRQEREPIIISPLGQIIDGANRLFSDNHWTMKVDNSIDSEEEALNERLLMEWNRKSKDKREEAILGLVNRMASLYESPSYNANMISYCKNIAQREDTPLYFQRFKGVDMNKEGYALATKTVAIERIAEELKRDPHTIKRYLKDEYKNTSTKRKTKNPKSSPFTTETDLICPSCKKEGLIDFHVSCEECATTVKFPIAKLKRIKTFKGLQQFIDNLLQQKKP
jgi:hypothetical protein